MGDTAPADQNPDGTQNEGNPPVAQEAVAVAQENGEQIIIDDEVADQDASLNRHSEEGSSSRNQTTSQTQFELEATFTEREVLKKISDLKDKLKIRAASVRKPTQFDEQKSDIIDFIEDFDNYREIIGLQKVDSYAAFLSYLGEKHKNKLRNLNMSPGLKENWDEVKLRIIDALTPPAQKLEARVKLNNARQSANETIVEFSERIKRLVDQCYDKPAEVVFRERIMKDHLVKGCRDDNVAVDMMARMETLTLHDLIKAGMAKELALKSRKLDASADSKSIEDSIAVLTVSDAHKMAYRQDQEAQNSNQPNTTQLTQRQDKRSNLTCYNCNKLGHFASECRDKKRGKNQQDCWNCGKIGHMARDCRLNPTIQGTNNRSNGYRPGKNRSDQFVSQNPRKFSKPNYYQPVQCQCTEKNPYNSGNDTNYQPLSRTVNFDEQSNERHQNFNYDNRSTSLRTPVNLMKKKTPGILPITGTQRTIVNDRALRTEKPTKEDNFGLSIEDEFEFDLN